MTDGNIRGLPNSFQTNGQVLGALLDNQLLGRPDDYQASLPADLPRDRRRADRRAPRGSTSRPTTW